MEIGRAKGVSAIITTYNRSQLLGRAIDSILNQTHAVKEIIIINDCSTDNTEEVVNSYVKYGNIIYLHTGRNIGACAARNIGISKSACDLIAGLDDDDEWHPERIEVLLQHYHPDWAYITSDYDVINWNGHVKQVRKKKIIDSKDMANSNLTGNQILVDKWKVMEINGFDENLRAAQDYDMFYRLNLNFGAALNVRRSLQKVYVNEGQNQISKNAKLGYIQFYFKHYNTFNLRNKISQIFRIKQVTGGTLPLKYLLLAGDFQILLKMVKYKIMKILYPSYYTH